LATIPLQNEAVMDEVAALHEIDASVEELVDRLDSVVKVALADLDGHYGRIVGIAHNEGVNVDHQTSEAQGAVFASAHVMLGIVDTLRSELDTVRGVVSQQQELLRAFQHNSLTDPLTGLINRRALGEDLQRRINAAKRGNSPLSLLFVDIDHFKQVNDRFGHDAGDKVIRSVANLMRNALRESDKLSRYGGEEFVAILPETGLLDACRAAERIRTAVSSSLIGFAEHEISVSVSIGVADCEPTTDLLMQRADQALLAAKRNGRDCVFVEQGCEYYPLRPHIDAAIDNFGRRFLRFRVEGMRVKLRRRGESWCSVEIVDESVTGIGLRISKPEQWTNGDCVEVEYCGEVRAAYIRNATPQGQGYSLGLEWREIDIA
jgi:diguanylate cyclase (GGDEF)-like protein